jgi:hypothetical protein
MSRMLVFALMVLIGSVAFAQTAEEYCAAEKADGESCYMDCCTSLGYSWSGGGCDVPDSEQAYVTQQCGSCADTYIQCVEYYQSQGSSGSTSTGYYDTGSSSSSGGCCAGFALMLALMGIVAVKAN